MKTILELIRAHTAFDEEIHADTPISSLSLDSLSFINLLVAIEEEYGVEFGDEELTRDRYASAGDLISAVEKRRRRKSRAAFPKRGRRPPVFRPFCGNERKNARLKYGGGKCRGKFWTA